MVPCILKLFSKSEIFTESWFGTISNCIVFNFRICSLPPVHTCLLIWPAQIVKTENNICTPRPKLMYCGVMLWPTRLHVQLLDHSRPIFLEYLNPLHLILLTIYYFITIYYQSSSLVNLFYCIYSSTVC